MGGRFGRNQTTKMGLEEPMVGDMKRLVQLVVRNMTLGVTQVWVKPWLCGTLAG